MIEHNESWQVFSPNGEIIQGESVPARSNQEEQIIGASHVWVWRRNNKSIQVLLQKRSHLKKTWPGFYDVSAAGHIDSGETAVVSAIRESSEEIALRVSSDELRYVFALRTPLAPNEIDYVFLHEVTKKFQPHFNDGEVEAVEWVDLSELKRRADEHDSNNLVNQGAGYFALLFSTLDKL